MKKKASKPIGFSRAEFQKMYGDHPDWMWQMLQRNYQVMLSEWRKSKKRG